MKEPQFNKNGYPTEETIEIIEKWTLKDGIGEWLGYMEDSWFYPDYAQWKGSEMHISTGGWSGNEDIIAAMKRNSMWHIVWVQSRRGGHYVFEIPGGDK